METKLVVTHYLVNRTDGWVEIVSQRFDPVAGSEPARRWHGSNRRVTAPREIGIGGLRQPETVAYKLPKK